MLEGYLLQLTVTLKTADNTVHHFFDHYSFLTPL